MDLVNFARRSRFIRSVFSLPLYGRNRWMGYRQAPAKAVLDRVEGLVASDVRLRVEEFDGEFILGPRSHILRRLLSQGFYEPQLVQLFLSHLMPDRDVVDVGANVGFFSVLAAKRLTTGRVLAAEPTTAAFSRLSQNVTINDVETKVILYNGLVSNEASLATLEIVPGREEYSSMGGIVHPSVVGQAVQTETVQARPLDSLVAENGLRPAVIKVDVEGAEGMVFEGAQQTLRDYRPVVLSEFSRPLLARNGSSPEAIIALFDRCGYDVHNPFDRSASAGAIDFDEIIAIPRPA